jgi:hypothetical protein
VCAAGIEERDEGCGPKRHRDLHGVRHGHPGQGLQGEARCLVVSPGRSVTGVVDLHPVNEEKAPAKSVVATRVFFVAVKTEPKTTPLRLFLWGQPPLVARAVAGGTPTGGVGSARG